MRLRQKRQPSLLDNKNLPSFRFVKRRTSELEKKCDQTEILRRLRLLRDWEIHNQQVLPQCLRGPNKGDSNIPEAADLTNQSARFMFEVLLV